MQVFRSPRAIVAAMAAAVMAYAYVAVRGAPAGIGWLAALGESELDARGGIVIDVKLSDPRAADETARAITSRLEAQGASVAIDRTATDHLRVTATGVLPERADAIARTAGMRGQLALRPARDHGPALDALAAVRAPGVANDQDTWSAEDGTWHTVPFLSADDRARLMIAIAKIDASPDEILIETVQPGGDTARGVRFRTYVVAPEVIVGNQDIESADAGADPYNERPVVNLSFGRAAAQRFGDWTAAHVGEKLAIVVDGEVTSAPIINSAIRGGRAVITMGSGGSSRDQWDQARELANALTAGYTFPAPVTAKVIDTRTASIARAHLARFLAAIAAAILALAIA
ncbi:MAG TPA: hypothetical protein VL463_34410, partial [Kofleriaceae bacterium]|nr:hypothetical protein [Kofleriaceae bacterium]